MTVHNRDIAAVFERVADLLDIEGANPFRVRAYRGAARTVAGLQREAADLLAEGQDLTGLPGIGKDLAGKIEELVRTGRMKQLEELEKEVPPQLAALMRIESLGPRRIQALHQELGITNLEDLIRAARENRIQELEGFGRKTEDRILQDALRVKESGAQGRLGLARAEEITEPLLGYLRKAENVDRVVAAGSYRRRQETVGDLDVLVTCTGESPVMDRFVEYGEVERVLSRGDTRSTVTLRGGFQVDVRVVPPESYGAALHYFTGSKAHNLAVRMMGIRKGLKVNEYGVFRDDRRVAGQSEEEVYGQVGLPYIEPELRENRGELQAGLENRLPGLVGLQDIRGDLQAHTEASDGTASLEQMAEAARRMGYEYLAVTDHSKRVTVAHGLDERRLAEQIGRIDRLNGRMKGFRLLKSCEVDILEDGTLDLPNDILKELDFVLGSVHYYRKLSREKQTERVLRAMDNPYFNILAHPTGRILGAREAYDIDLERVMEAAARGGCFLELNAHPDRLDLDDTACRRARELGLRVPISTDAHSTDNLSYMRYGVYQARRGWLAAGDVLNTRPWCELEKLFRRK